MVFQNYALYPHMSVFDNMAFGLKLRKVPKEEITKRVKSAAEILEIEDLLDRRPKALSARNWGNAFGCATRPRSSSVRTSPSSEEPALARC